MTQEHLIRPPHELVQQWVSLACENEGYETWQDLATQAARWGADQELKACCEWLLDHGYDLLSPEMRKDRRPKPPSLKEQALEALETEDDSMPLMSLKRAERFALIRRALESLPE